MSFFGLFGSKKKEHTEEQHAAAPAAAPAPQAAPPDVQQDIMAAISAAVYVVMYSSENTTITFMGTDRPFKPYGKKAGMLLNLLNFL